MDKKNEKIVKDISTGYFAMVKELDLNELFKLTYNFDLLKGLITSMLKNQESLKNQIEKETEKNNEQNTIIENLKNDIELMQEKFMTKESAKAQINEINNNINKIEEEIKGKFKGKKKSIKYIKKEKEEGEENETNENKEEEYTFEEDNEEEKYKKYINDKFAQIDKKFKIIVGDINLDEEEEEEKEDDDEFNINSNYYKNINSTKSAQSKKAKNFSLSEINQRLNQLNSIKLNKSDFGKYSEKIMGVETKVNSLISNLFGEKIDNAEDIKSKNIFSFVTKEEFDKNKAKNQEEFVKIWEEIKNLRNIKEEIENKLKEKVSFKDLESFQSLIHQKIEELFLMQNKKYSHNSTIIQILQDQFKKLLELLSQRENQESGNFLISKKPMSGYSCASCDTYLGELKNDQNKFVNWKKMPIKEKEIKEEQFFKVGNGYSRLLQMINFDNNGKMTLNPFANNKNNNDNSNSSVSYKNKSTSSNDLNRSSSKDRVIYSVRNKRDYSKEKNKTIDINKSTNGENISDKKLPIIKPSMSIDNYEKLSGKKSDIHPRIKSKRNNSQF